MNRFQKLSSAAVIATLPLFAGPGAGTASAQTVPGPYVALEAGSDMPQNTDFDVDVNIGPIHQVNHGTSTWANAYGAAIEGGWKWGFGLRTEAEISFRSQGIKSFGGRPWNGTQWDNSFFINTLYDIQTGTPFTPYFGFGIGGTHLAWLNNFRPAGINVNYDAGDLQFGYQGIFGVAYAFTPQIDGLFDFRIKGANGFTFPASVAGVVAKNFDYETESLFVGIRYQF